MKLIADLHTHTLASSHAFSTLKEMVDRAKETGLCAMAVTDHGIAMPDAPHRWYFNNILNLPQVLEDGFILLRGVEANALDLDGTLDMEEERLRQLDWVVVSLHTKCIPPLSYEDATKLWLRVAQNPLVDMIGHSEEQRYFYDYDRVCRAFAETGKVVEINGNSPVSRPGNEENLVKLVRACRQHGVLVSVNSDAHSVYDLGNQGWALELLEREGFPEEQIINTSMQRLKDVLVRHGRAAAACFP